MIEDTMFDYDCYAVFLEKEHEKGEAMDDTISRQAAVDEIRKCRFVVDAIEKIRGLPSADRPSGEWVEDTYGWVYCSHCKKYLDDYQMVFFLKPFDYCPNCGSKMVREDGKA